MNGTNLFKIALRALANKQTDILKMKIKSK